MASTPEGPLSSSSPSEQEETPAQRQARLRRERRNQKIQAGGNARLAAISNISGRQGPPPETRSSPVTKTASPSDSPTPAARPPNPFVAPDPDEVDISSHAFQPRLPAAQNASAQSQQVPPQMADDPMMAMMQQMLRGMDPNAPPGAPGSGDLPPGFPPGLAKMFEAMNGGAGGTTTEELQHPAKSSAYLWRIVHAVFSLVLAVYIAFITSFSGSKADRSRTAATFEDDDFYGATGGSGAHIGQRLFWMFATAEIVLQTSRYFLEKGRLPQSGLLGSLSQMLPEPYAGYARVIGRYSVIFNTVAADALVVIFVLGAVSWWQAVIA